MVDGLVAGTARGQPTGPRTTRTRTSTTIGKAFKWDREKTKAELAKVHLSNGPENLAFFSGAIDAAGSFGGIYQSAVYAYGSELIKDPVDAERFARLQRSRRSRTAGAFAGQQIAIAPIKTARRRAGGKRSAAQQKHPLSLPAEQRRSST